MKQLSDTGGEVPCVLEVLWKRRPARANAWSAEMVLKVPRLGAIGTPAAEIPQRLTTNTVCQLYDFTMNRQWERTVVCLPHERVAARGTPRKVCEGPRKDHALLGKPIVCGRDAAVPIASVARPLVVNWDEQHILQASARSCIVRSHRHQHRHTKCQ